MNTKTKGNVLEDLVAGLHVMPGTDVQTRAKLPVLHSGGKRQREIDVLATTAVDGHQIRFAFSCKNETKRLAVGHVGEFQHSLQEVGIPIGHGILVSSTGFTSDAIDAARQIGMRTLTYEGLTSDRLSEELGEATHNTLFLVAAPTLSITEFVPDASAASWHGETEFINSKELPSLDVLFTTIWKSWIDGRITPTLGDHPILILPENPETSWAAIADVRVQGFIGSQTGTHTRAILRDAVNRKIDRARISAQFGFEDGPLRLSSVASEAEISHIAHSDQGHLVTRIQVPRLQTNAGYWPPTLAEGERLKERYQRGLPIDFDSIAGSNLADAWPGKHRG